MKFIKSLIVTSILFAFSANSQITKGNWMVGGNASLSFISSNDNSSKTTILNVSPNVGYFFFDKFSFGTLLNYSNSKTKDAMGGSSIYKNVNIGPFARYYILNKEKDYNLFYESSYNFSLLKENKNTEFGNKLGTVIFLNSSVGFEFSLKYSINKYKYPNGILPDSKSDNFIFGLGLQIHLEK
jgi:hypothetical protein